MKRKRIEDYGVQIGELRKGPLNKITDVPGVAVGHATIDTEDNKTGVTVIMPTEGNIFQNKLPAASYVLNGFGKSAGFAQIEELGTLETPIALTNTLNVGLVHDALVEYMIERCRLDGVEVQSINPIVCECNDSKLNNIQHRAVTKAHVFEAIDDCRVDFDEGDVGGGKGMVCHSLKGGIGSASRLIELGDKTFTVGVLVQSNHGALKDLTINGDAVGRRIESQMAVESTPDEGSIIIIVATDIPLSDRQIRRAIKRSSVGLARLGSYIGHGSGEFMLGFSTADAINHERDGDLVRRTILNETKMDLVFRAVAESCEEAVLNSMAAAEAVTGYRGRTVQALKTFL